VSVRQNRDITEIRDKFPSRYSQTCTDSSDQNYKNNEGIKRRETQKQNNSLPSN